jgi:predicted phosphodiesterase
MNAAGKWSPVHIEQDILTQVFLCMDKFAQQLAVWSNCFNEVKFYGVYGNHGRASLRGVEKDFVNWDYVMYKFLEAKAQNYKNVEFHVGKSWMQIAQVQNTKFLLVHGDDIKGTMGIPFYGIQRAEGRYRSLLEQFKTKNEAYTICKPYIEKVNKNPESIDAAFELIQAVMIYTKSFDNLVLGHIHNAASWHTNAGGKVIVNGAFYGGDVHSIKQLQSANPPVQKFFGVNSKGLTWQYDLELDRK